MVVLIMSYQFIFRLQDSNGRSIILIFARLTEGMDLVASFGNSVHCLLSLICTTTILLIPGISRTAILSNFLSHEVGDFTTENL
jgi:hypothetical protein